MPEALTALSSPASSSSRMRSSWALIRLRLAAPVLRNGAKLLPEKHLREDLAHRAARCSAESRLVISEVSSVPIGI